MAHQAGGAVEQVFDGDQAVFLQGASRGHQINDRFGHAGDRTQLHRTRQMDQLHRQVEGSEILLGAAGELAGHAAMGGQVHGLAIGAAGLHRHTHAATAKAQVHQLGHGQGVLAQHVVAHHAQLGLAVGHIDGHIGITHQQGPGAAAGTLHPQLAIHRIEQGRKIQTGRGKTANGILKQAAFGQSDSDHGNRPRPGL